MYWNNFLSGGRVVEGRVTEDEIVGSHHWLNGHEFEQTPEVSEGQGSLLCCSPWGCRESDMTEQMKKKFFFDTRKLIVRNKIAFSTSINDRCILLFCPWVILYICMLLTIVDKYVYLNAKLWKSPFSCILIKNPDFKFYLSCWVRKQQDWFSLWSNLTERTMKKCPESVLFGNTKKRNLSCHVFKNNFQLSLTWN